MALSQNSGIELKKYRNGPNTYDKDDISSWWEKDGLLSS